MFSPPTHPSHVEENPTNIAEAWLESDLDIDLGLYAPIPETGANHASAILVGKVENEDDEGGVVTVLLVFTWDRINLSKLTFFHSS